jgi:branched-chain amino acid aminotransferase
VTSAVATSEGGKAPAIAALAYHDGDFVPLERAQVPVTTQALQYGTGVFEGIRAYAQPDGGLAIFRGHDHYARFLKSSRTLRIDVGLSVEQLSEVTAELLRRIGATSDMYIRPLAYKRSLLPGTPPGVQLSGVSDALSINAFRMGSYTDRGGIRVAISSWRRPESGMLPVRAKVTGAYVNNALAVDEARAGGYDDAILLNSRGQVAEASTANVFAVIRGRLVTPPITADLLEGITRDTVVTLAGELMDVETDFHDLGRDDLCNADEVFLTGTGAEIVPVTEIGGRVVGDGDPGPLTTALMTAYHEVVRGKNERYHHWLQAVGVAAA